MKHTSCDGPLYAHLGHFRKAKNLRKGHNDVPDSQAVLPSVAPSMDTIQQRSQNQSPENISALQLYT